MMRTVIKKELRGYFNSAIAVIFLAVFLAVALGTFFWWEKFFARGVADLRPLFEWMPRLLIVLVSALSMRLWAEERRAGTLEILLTLPVPRWQLVVGKFLAGMVLIAVALVLTLGLPITVSRMGNLDLGPVVGGYLAALLLSAAYLAIGMCVSAATDNQIVAFIGTAAACVLTYVVGYLGGDVGRLFGTGARFESVARGVLDLRDLAYYGGIVCIGIALNVILLERLTWGRGARGRARRLAALLGIGLVAVNAIALDLWLAPVRHARIDLTQGGTYSLSESTHKILGGLDERLLLRGYFSEKTHPKLAPLVPQLRDLLEEYRLAGGGKVRVEVIDPTDSDDAKRDAKERFGIDPRPLPFTSQTEESVINAYFAIAIEYGGQHAVIGLDDLIAVRRLDLGELEISLKNPEYQLTRTIKKTVSEFSSVDALFASTAGKIKLTAYVTPKTLPEAWKDGPDKLKKVVAELTKQAGGKLEFQAVEPTTEAEMRELFEKYRLRPYPVDLFSGQVYYFHLLLQVGDRVVRIMPPQNLGDAELKAAITEGLKRAAPGFTRVVGLWSPPAPPAMPPMQGMPPQEMPPPQTFRVLRQALAGNYEVRDVELSAPVPDDVEALVLAGPAALDAKAVEHLDQFMMRGGAVVALAGRYRIAFGAGMSVDKVTTGLEAAFQKWGITVGDDLVMDTKSDTLPVPDEHDVGNGMVIQEVQQLPYPFFVKMTGDQVSSASVITSGLAGSVMHWASPVSATAKVGDDEHRVDVLLTSSDASWLTSSTAVGPNLRTYPGLGFPGPKPTDKQAAQVLAVAVTGGFASSVAKPRADKPDPATPAGKDAPRLIEHSPADTRIVVFGSSTFASDLVQQLESPLSRSNIELVHNAVDWSLADTDLLAIRSRNSATRVLTIGPDAAGGWRTANIVIAIAGLVLVVGIAWLRRRAVRPIAMTKEA
jgi:gliding motility-associated transport system permease protein/gliding motility-associatede transport system auxiliary component